MGSYALAIDLGASGGRHIVGRIEGDQIALTEVYRFQNDMVQRNDHLCWDRDALFAHILVGMKKCAELGMVPATVGIDTWGVDYTLMNEDGNPVGDSVAYRDARTEGMPARLDASISPRKLYAATGVARQSYNTVYQLMAENLAHPRNLAENPRLLFTPSYLSYRLCGIARNEYSMASTSGLLNARTCGWNRAVLSAAGIPANVLGGKPVPSGTPLGFLSPDIAEAVGFSCKVVLTTSHDTAGAYLATPVSAGNPAILSSGTWSLLGMELDRPITTEAARRAGFTNEKGYNAKVLFIRNITGLWILQAICREWNRRLSYAEMAETALGGKDYQPIFDASDERFLSPACMSAEILAALSQSGAPTPANDAQLLYCIHHSLACCYQVAVDHLSRLTGRPVTAIHVVGGGCQNRTLNQLTADCTGLTVYAGPVEATALGNLAVQWIAEKQIDGVTQARRIIQNSVQREVYSPRPTADREPSV